MDCVNEDELRKGLMGLREDGEIFEVRMISSDGKTNYSGYFQNADTLISALEKMNLRDFNIYCSLNGVNSACYSRPQSGKFLKNPKNTTSDADIAAINWLMVDLDPKRPAGTSSSNEELNKAKLLGNKIFLFMRNLGFNEPVTAYSGNGVHLLYKVALSNTSENVELLKRCLQALAILFSDDDVEVDQKTFNPSRICKLYGTLAQKGSNTKDRPFRMSRIKTIPTQIKPNDINYLRKLADMMPGEPEKPQRYNNWSPRDFDIEAWMSRYGIAYRKTNFGGGNKYILDHCPFDPSHNGKDACIFQSPNGAIGFHCFHNSCAGKTWKDVRIKFEPEAYEKREQWMERQMYRNFNRNKKPEPVHITEETGNPVFYTAMDIFNMPKQEESFIRTGTTEIDRRMRGLKKGAVSLVSGLRGASKSTILSQWCLDAVDNGFNIGCYSGELSANNFMKWMWLQAAGKGHVVASEKWEGYYTVPRAIQKKISEWMGKRFWLYNNAYGNDFHAVLEQFHKRIEDDKLDLLVLDNLMAFNITGLAETKWDAQTAFVMSLHELAQQKDVHIVFVAHPRKALGFLRLDDISGTADLANAVDNAFIVHRNNKDFQRMTKQMFGWKDDNEVYESTNVIEIAKDRDGGTQDVFVPLFYERESKRLKNSIAESIIYGWDKVSSDGGGFVDIPPDDDMTILAEEFTSLDGTMENPFG